MNHHFLWSPDAALAVFAVALVCLVLPAGLLWERRHARPALYALGRPILRPSVPLVFGVACLILALGACVLRLLHPQTFPLSWTVAQCLGALAAGISPLLQAFSSWRITEKGLSYPLGTLRWQRIRAWGWTDAPDRPGIRVLEVNFPRFFQLRWCVVPGHEDQVAHLLHDHLGGVSVGAP